MSSSRRSSSELAALERRASRRIAGASIPWLTAASARVEQVILLDISDSGALIETPASLRPGERDSFVLRGDNTVRVGAEIIRAEVTRISPSVSYRSAIRFSAPVQLGALIGDTLVSAPRVITPQAAPLLSKRFVGLVKRLSGVRAVRLSSSLAVESDIDSVFFEVPDSDHGTQRLLQVFFDSDHPPSPEAFVRLKTLALVASGIPDVHITL
jgi:hypothetical protein